MLFINSYNKPILLINDVYDIQYWLAEVNAVLLCSEATTCETLTGLDLSYCRAITNRGIAHLKRCTNLTRLDCSNTQVRALAILK